MVLYRNGFKPRKFQVSAGLLGAKSKEHVILEKEAAAFEENVICSIEYIIFF